MGTWFATSVTDFAPLNLLTLFEYIQFRIHAHSNIIFCYTLSHWEKLTTTWNEWKHSHTIVLSHPNQSLTLSLIQPHNIFFTICLYMIFFGSFTPYREIFLSLQSGVYSLCAFHYNYIKMYDYFCIFSIEGNCSLTF